MRICAIFPQCLQWCQSGECVYDTEAPSALDDCTYGDYKGPYTNGLNCKVIGTQKPWICYNNYYLDDCCKTCEDIKDTQNPGEDWNCFGKIFIGVTGKMTPII